MAKGGPTLFELMNSIGRVQPEDSAHQPITPASRPPMDAPEPGLFSASRSVRVPMGYLFVAIAAIVATLAMVFSMGYQSGQQSRDRQDARELQAASVANQAGAPRPVIRDPLRSPLPEKQPALAPNEENSVDTTVQPRLVKAPPSGDRRIVGMNYFIVAYCEPGLAQRTVAYLRESGVDAEAVSAHNGAFQYVISLEPFSAEQVGSPAYREHRALLKRLGRVWKRDHNGPDDFSEVWAQKYRPPQTQAADDQSQASAVNR